jgi:hypothetical protein
MAASARSVGAIDAVRSRHCGHVDRHGDSTEVPIEVGEQRHVRQVRRLGPRGKEARKGGAILRNARCDRRMLVNELAGRLFQAPCPNQPRGRREPADHGRSETRLVVTSMNLQALRRLRPTDEACCHRCAAWVDHGITNLDLKVSKWHG